MRWLCLVLIVWAWGVAGGAAAVAADEAWREMVASENAFAAMSVKEGIRASFLAYLAEGSVILRPEPVPARPLYEKVPADRPTRLSWDPGYAWISLAGDMGYTTGPWEVRRQAGEEPSAWGHFVYVSRKGEDGRWQVAYDAGVSHARPEPPIPPAGGQPARPAPEVRPPHSVPPLRPETLAEAEQRLAEAVAKESLSKVVERLGTADVRLYRGERLPGVGPAAAAALASAEVGRWSWQVQGTGLSKAGDLGYVYGVADFIPAGAAPDASPARFGFCRIWRLEHGKWRLGLDIHLPMKD